MRTPSKIITALALAGIAVAGGAAFTASGVTDNAPAAVFGGGSVSQTVTGAQVNSIVYTYETGANTAIATVAVTFKADEAIYGKTVDAVLANGTGDQLGTQDAPLASGHLTLIFTSATGYTNADALNITVHP